jgi:hypothetical protein
MKITDVISENWHNRDDAYEKDVKSSQIGFDRQPRDWDEGDQEPPNNFAIYINGKKWKVLQGNGTYADDHREKAQYQRLKDMCAKKTAATGKKWSVHVTGENPTLEENSDAPITAANVSVGAVYKNKPAKQAKNKDGTAKNALDMKANLMTGGSIKR